MICLLFAIFGSGDCTPPEEVKPQQTRMVITFPEPIVREAPSEVDIAIAESTDGKSMWEVRWEEMTGEEFVREPMTPEQIAQREAENASPAGGRFIFIEN